MGGEKERVNRCACWTEGSPPHGRGKVAYIGNKNGLDGITPAWAGKSAPVVGAGVLTGNHPRVGGEKSFSPFDIFPDRESPPRGRGKD